MKQNTPRSEYPRPQFVRDQWMNLNGLWQFYMDFDQCGIEHEYFRTANFPNEQSTSILVPFCPESTLSGIGYKDFIPAVWYRRTVTLTEEQLTGRTLLHFGAVDFHTTVWVNGQKAGEHFGGYASFTFDVTAYLKPHENEIVVLAEDDVRSALQPSGKQSVTLQSKGCAYSRTTGIWQTVWLEFVPMEYIRRAKITPFVSDQRVFIEVESCGGAEIAAQVLFADQKIAEATAKLFGNRAVLDLVIPDPILWDVGTPNLYDVILTLDGGDCVRSYFGMRSVELKKDGLYLNGRPLYMRTILDQGFYPEGICTAPSDEALKKDIELSMELGFNGARFHQRAFEERSLYWADRLGYLVWAESAYNPARNSADAFPYFLNEWIEIVQRDYNHPCIIGWMPENETFFRKDLHEANQIAGYRVTKQMDPYRPVIDASGGVHFETDLFDVHEYEQDPEKLRQLLKEMEESSSACYIHHYKDACRRNKYEGQAYWISEYGGTFWNPDQKDGWGYGSTPKSEAEFAQRYAGLTTALLEHPRICGFCYTQLTDIEQEQNGLYKYDRSKKFSNEVYDAIRKANTGASHFEKK